ncbi:hypothetical protein K450DRAFT_236832 [Umbelopsis ramanniana AG]|uniref:Uncharacterized protein n=1 Tax=Umbelopsis ramanniana AG TaxID=1314678 RepID=A0AAD5EBQ4_UMBRA|nr:uncharacterized protein K450DRAFT_236832 [Umbelopsis ramanniana AG]KAI8580392.1 hypothetical protein K450DRAFT_236832 [Umbelopsis ramanniana AG]
MVKKLSLAGSYISKLLEAFKQQPTSQPGWLELQNKNYYNRPNPERNSHESYLKLYGEFGPPVQEYEWWAVIMANRLSALETKSGKTVNTHMMLLIRQVKDDIAKELNDLWSADDTNYILSKTDVVLVDGSRIISNDCREEWTQQDLSDLNSKFCGCVIDMLVLHGIVASPLDAGDYHHLGLYVDIGNHFDYDPDHWSLYVSILVSRYIVSKNWSRIIERVQGVISFATDMNINSTLNVPTETFAYRYMEQISRKSIVTPWNWALNFDIADMAISWPGSMYIMTILCFGDPTRPLIAAIANESQYWPPPTTEMKMNSMFDRRGFYVSVRTFTYPLLLVLVIIELFVLVGGISKWEPMVIDGVDPTSLASLVIVLEGLLLAFVVATFHDNWSWYDMVRGQIVYENYYDLPAVVKNNSYAVDVITQAMSNREACKHILSSYGSCVTGITGDGTVTLPVLNDDVLLADTPFLTVANEDSSLLIDLRERGKEIHLLKGAYNGNRTLHFDQQVETVKLSDSGPYVSIPFKLRVGSSLGFGSPRLEMLDLLKGSALNTDDKLRLALQYQRVYRDSKKTDGCDTSITAATN